MRFFLIFFFMAVSILHGEEAITYFSSGGRFGDQLLAYLHAKWFSYKYDIPLLYKPSYYLSGLNLDSVEKHFENQPFKEEIEVKSLSSFLPKDDNRSILYICNHFPETPYERDIQKTTLSIDWKDEGFRSLVKGLLTPKKELKLIQPKSGCINVALHLRIGRLYDPIYSNQCFPLKFPDYSYYTEALKKVISCFEGKPIYCFIFTDDLYLSMFMSKFTDEIKNKEVIFDYRKEGFYYENVLEDFFSFFNFDVLIRPDSYFSIIPSLLNDYAIVIAPKTFHRKMCDVIIDEFDISINEKLYQKLKQRPCPVINACSK